MADDDCQIVFAKINFWPPIKAKKEEDDSITEDMALINLLDASLSVRSLTAMSPKKEEDNDCMIEEGEISMDSAADRSLPPSDDEQIVVSTKKTKGLLIHRQNASDRKIHRHSNSQRASERKIIKTASRRISKRRRKEKDHQKVSPVLLQLAVKVKNLLCNDNTSFLAVQKLVEAIFTKRCDSTRDLEQLMRQPSDKFMRMIHDYLMDFDWKRLDATLVNEVLDGMRKRADLVKNNKSLLKPMLEAESSILPFAFSQFCGNARTLRLVHRKIVADGEVINPLAVAWDGQDFLFAGQGKLFSCSERGDGLKVLYKTTCLPTALAVVCPKEVVAFIEGNAIKMYYKLEKKVETHVTGLSHPRGLAYIRGAILTLELFNGIYYISAYSYTKQRIGRHHYGDGKPSFMTSSTGRLYITDLRNQAVSVFEVTVSSDHTRATFKTITTNQLGKGGVLHEDRTVYPAGIAADSRGEIIVSDARHDAESRVLWFNALVSKWSRVEIPQGVYPYGSQIAISPSGYFLVACRQSHSMSLFQFVS